MALVTERGTLPISGYNWRYDSAQPLVRMPAMLTIGCQTRTLETWTPEFVAGLVQKYHNYPFCNDSVSRRQAIYMEVMECVQRNRTRYGLGPFTGATVEAYAPISPTRDALTGQTLTFGGITDAELRLHRLAEARAMQNVGANSYYNEIARRYNRPTSSYPEPEPPRPGLSPDYSARVVATLAWITAVVALLRTIF